MHLATSTFYYKPRPKSSDGEILEEICKIIENLGPTGYIAMTAILRNSRIINKKKVYRIMCENGLLCPKKPKKPTFTTDSNHNFLKYENLTKTVVPDDVGQVLVGDVTQFDIQGKNGYLALLMDLFNREIVGYAVSSQNNTALVSRCFQMAQRKYKSLKNCIHHTDADVRYCSYDYTAQIIKAGMKISMICGNAYENAHAESLNKTIKYKEINLNEYRDEFESEIRIGRYIENYNSIKPHSALGMLSPTEFTLKKSKKVIPIPGG